MACEQEIFQIARACARGPRQEALIEEMIAGTADWHFEWIPAIGKNVVYYGKSRLSSQSYAGLRNRLRQHGFTITVDRRAEGGQVELRYKGVCDER